MQISEFVKANYIKTRYLAQEGIWQLLQPKHFVNVLLIHHMERRGEKEIFDVASLMREGLAGGSHKLSSSYNENPEINSLVKTHYIADVFKSFQKPDGTTVTPEVIIIDGAPGMGKTTLSKEMAYQWANGQLLTENSIIFFIYLRDPEIHQIYDLQSFIHYYYNFDKAAFEFSKQCADVLVKRNNKDITIILDGYDEYFDVSGDLFLTRIINRKEFTQSKLVITTRPIATDKLQHVADVRVEVMGFTDNSKQEYIVEELKYAPDKMQRLLLYLNKNRAINSICYIPMIMTILVCTFKEEDDLPTDQTELYERFVTLAVSRYLQKLESNPNSEILPLQNLPFLYHQYIKELSKFAFDTLKDDKIVFSENDIETLCPNLASANRNFQGLGLLKSTQYFSMKRIKKCLSYNFLHLSIQEFLAAYYIKSLKPNVQFELLKNSLFLNKYLNTWVLFSGLIKSDMFQFFPYAIHGVPCEQMKNMAIPRINNLGPIQAFVHFAQTCINYPSNTYFKLFCYKNSETELFNKMNLPNDTHIKIWLLKCTTTAVWNTVYFSLCHADTHNGQVMETFIIDKSIQEAVYAKIASQLLENSQVSVMIINMWSMIAYRANKQQIIDALKINEELYGLIMSNCVVDDETAELISQYIKNKRIMMFALFSECFFINNNSKLIFDGLSSITTLLCLQFNSTVINEDAIVSLASVITCNKNLNLVQISNCNLQAKSIKIATALKNISSLTMLNLSENNIPGSIADELSIAIIVNCKLTSLNFANNNLQSYGVRVASALCQLKSLTHLNFNNNCLTDNVAGELALAFEGNRSLQELYLGNNSLKTDGMVKIAQSLSWLSTLRILKINDNHITEEAADALAVAVSSNNQLEELDLNNNLLRKGINKIACALIANSTSSLGKLRLSSNQIPEEVAISLAGVINSNCLLEVLDLSDNNLRTDGMIAIGQSLSRLSTLKTLNVGSNKIGYKAADTIALIILSNIQLQSLILSNNHLERGAKTIANALKNISSLKELYFYNNQIPEGAAENLADAIISNRSLQVIALQKNNLKSKGIMIISKAISKLSGLQTLSIFNNHVHLTDEVGDAVALAVSNNLNISSIYLCENNLQASFVKVTNAVTHLSIKELNFRESNISETVGLTLAVVMSNQHHLEKLVLDNNNLGSNGVVMLSSALCKMNSLKLLNLQNNAISEKAADSLALGISSNFRLEHLYLGSNKLCIGALKIIRVLKSMSTIKTLDLNDNEMSAVVADELASAITKNSTLQALYIRNNNMATNGIITIAQALSKISTLKSLNIRSNKISERAADYLVKLILSNDGMKDLWLGNNSLKTGALKILKALKATSKLKTLGIDNNNIPEKHFDEIASVICNCHDLHTLYLEGNELQNYGVSIVQALCKTKMLSTVDLSSTDMNEALLNLLADAIISSASLQDLQLFNNNLRTEEVINLSQVLSKLTTINELDLRSNQITDKAACAIGSVMLNNDICKLYLSNNDLRAGLLTIMMHLKDSLFIKSLYLGHNSIPDNVCVKLANLIGSIPLNELDLSFTCLKLSGRFMAQALCKINTLTSLNLNNCYMTDAVSTDLSFAILNNPSLKLLYLAYNYLKTSGVMSVCKALNSLSALKELNIQRNVATEMAAEEIASALLSNSNIKKIILGGNKLNSIPIMKALQTVSSIVYLHFNYMELTEIVATDLALAIHSNPLLGRLYIACNVLHNSLIKVVTACKESSKNLKTLDIRCNCVDSFAVADLTSVSGSISTLEALFLGSLSVTSDENILLSTNYKINQLYQPSYMNSVAEYKMLEVLIGEIQKQSICNRIKVHHFLNYLSFNYADCVLECFELLSIDNFKTILQRAREKIVQVDSRTAVYFLPIVAKLKVLDLEQMNVDEVSAFELAALLCCNRVLEQLWLGSNQLGITGAIFILNSLEYMSTIKVLDMSFNNIGYQSGGGMAALIYNNPLLEQLWLDGNNLMDEGVLQIFHALQCIAKLRILSLSSNQITDNAAEDLSKAIYANIFLEDLALGDNKLQNDGIYKISHSIYNLRKLRKLLLSDNKFTKEAANSLANIISNCYTLQELYLSDNMLETEGAVKIFKSLKHKSKLQVFTLGNNKITDEAIDELCLVLAQNPRLQVLSLGGNKLQTDGAVRIAQVVKQENTIIGFLCLNGNNVCEQGKRQINMIFFNNTLVHVFM